MNLKEKLKKQQYNEIWQQYCGFLDLSMDGYMKIQRRLMEEQIQLWSNCGPVSYTHLMYMGEIKKILVKED